MERSETPLSVDAYVGLGSNVGPRLRTLQAAAHMMTVWPETFVVSSPVYETEAHVLPGADRQPDHLNAVVGIRTSLGALELLGRLQALERAAGRDTDASSWAPRPLDLDVLIYGSEISDSDELAIPHPRLAERRFVLQPLATLAPDLVVPGTASTVSQLLERTSDPARIHRTDFALLPADSRVL